jgi:hypothetical protein
MARVCCVLWCITGLALSVAACGGDAEPAAERASAPDAGEEAFVAKVDGACADTQAEARAGPRFPFRAFDPTNPHGGRAKLVAVGRFFEELDSEGLLAALGAELEAIEPPPALRAGYERMLADLEHLAEAMREQTAAALSGERERLVAATLELEEVIETQHDSAADMHAFACALSLERWAKALR